MPRIPDAQAEYKLHSSGATALAALFGSLLAGTIPLAVNDNRLRRPVRVWSTLFLGLLAQIGFLAMVLRIFPCTDSPMPGLTFVLLSPVIVYGAAKALQDDALHDHRNAGAGFAPLWQAAAVGIVFCILFYAATLAGRAMRGVS